MDAGRERMVRIVGERYADCDFSTFNIGDDNDTKERRHCGQVAFRYAALLEENCAGGRNLVFSGPKGTGKDHLAVSVLRRALSKGMTVAMVRGSVLMREMLEGIKSGDGIDLKYESRDILLLSDIEPRADKTGSTFFQESLLDLIDARYRQNRPIIVTTNTESRDEMVNVIGDRAVDRLLEGAVIIRTNWASYRNPKEASNA